MQSLFAGIWCMVNPRIVKQLLHHAGAAFSIAVARSCGSKRHHLDCQMNSLLTLWVISPEQQSLFEAEYVVDAIALKTLALKTLSWFSKEPIPSARSPRRHHRIME